MPENSLRTSLTLTTGGYTRVSDGHGQLVQPSDQYWPPPIQTRPSVLQTRSVRTLSLMLQGSVRTWSAALIGPKSAWPFCKYWPIPYRSVRTPSLTQGSVKTWSAALIRSKLSWPFCKYRPIPYRSVRTPSLTQGSVRTWSSAALVGPKWA